VRPSVTDRQDVNDCAVAVAMVSWRVVDVGAGWLLVMINDDGRTESDVLSVVFSFLSEEAVVSRSMLPLGRT